METPNELIQTKKNATSRLLKEKWTSILTGADENGSWNVVLEGNDQRQLEARVAGSITEHVNILSET